jgi:putative ATP-dependent endonuclease of OLD family
VLQAFSKAHLGFGGFIDNEGKHTGRWAEIKSTLGDLLFQWSLGFIEENIINLLPDEQLIDFVVDPADQKTGYRLRNLADRLGLDSKDVQAIKAKAGSDLRQHILDAALGKASEGTSKERVKAYKTDTQIWFKTHDGGRELADKMFSLGLWGKLSPHLLPFCNAVRRAIGLPDVKDLVT